jgi:hypothetical protein
LEVHFLYRLRGGLLPVDEDWSALDTNVATVPVPGFARRKIPAPEFARLARTRTNKTRLHGTTNENCRNLQPHCIVPLRHHILPLRACNVTNHHHR